jgi:hypothetical protein
MSNSKARDISQPSAASLRPRNPPWRHVFGAGMMVVVALVGSVSLASIAAQHGFEWRGFLRLAVDEYRKVLFPLYDVAFKPLKLHLTLFEHDLVTFGIISLNAVNAESLLRDKRPIWFFLLQIISSLVPWRGKDSEVKDLEEIRPKSGSLLGRMRAFPMVIGVVFMFGTFGNFLFLLFSGGTSGDIHETDSNFLSPLIHLLRSSYGGVALWAIVVAATLSSVVIGISSVAVSWFLGRERIPNYDLYALRDSFWVKVNHTGQVLILAPIAILFIAFVWYLAIVFIVALTAIFAFILVSVILMLLEVAAVAAILAAVSAWRTVLVANVAFAILLILNSLI